MNGMVYMRGQPADYEVWADSVEGEGNGGGDGVGARPWSWEDMQPLLDRELNYQADAATSPAGHTYGTGGRYHVEKPRLR